MRSLVQVLFVPGLILAFCAIYSYRNRFVPVGDMMLVTPVTIVLVVLVLLECVRLVRAERTAPLAVRDVARPVLFLAAVAGFAYGAGFDFVLSGIIFTAITLFILGEVRPHVIIGNSLIGPPVLFYIFNNIMGVPLNSFIGGLVS